MEKTVETMVGHDNIGGLARYCVNTTGTRDEFWNMMKKGLKLLRLGILDKILQKIKS